MVKCPIINQEIDIGKCVTVVDVSENVIKDTVIPDNIKAIEKWQDICKKCKYHNN